MGVIKRGCGGAAGSFGQQAQRLAPGGDRSGQFDASAGGLAQGLGGFRIHPQAGGQVGFAEPEEPQAQEPAAERDDDYDFAP